LNLEPSVCPECGSVYVSTYPTCIACRARAIFGAFFTVHKSGQNETMSWQDDPSNPHSVQAMIAKRQQTASDIAAHRAKMTSDLDAQYLLKKGFKRSGGRV
jgi:hypothetical protein